MPLARLVVRNPSLFRGGHRRLADRKLTRLNGLKNFAWDSNFKRSARESPETVPAPIVIWSGPRKAPCRLRHGCPPESLKADRARTGPGRPRKHRDRPRCRLWMGPFPAWRVRSTGPSIGKTACRSRLETESKAVNSHLPSEVSESHPSASPELREAPSP